jgi:hypothetical protein
MGGMTDLGMMAAGHRRTEIGTRFPGSKREEKRRPGWVAANGGRKRGDGQTARKKQML